MTLATCTRLGAMLVSLCLLAGCGLVNVGNRVVATPRIIEPTPTIAPSTLEQLPFDPQALALKNRVQMVDACVRGTPMQLNYGIRKGYGYDQDAWYGWTRDSEPLTWYRWAIDPSSINFKAGTNGQEQSYWGWRFYADQQTITEGGFYSAFIPKEFGWDVRLDWNGYGYNITFYQYAAKGQPAFKTVNIASTMAWDFGAYKVPNTNYEIYLKAILSSGPETAFQDESVRFLTSPENLRVQLSSRLDAYLRKIESTLQQPTISGKPGFPDAPTVQVNPSPEERNQMLAKARTSINDQIALVQNSYREMYAALQSAFPYEKCWK